MWNKKYKKNDNIIQRKIAEETFLVPVRGTLVDMKKIFCLDGVGEVIWAQIDENSSLADIRDRLLKDFDVEKEDLDSDMLDFMNRLMEAELIEEVCEN